jgi:hypothetical protein
MVASKQRVAGSNPAGRASQVSWHLTWASSTAAPDAIPVLRRRAGSFADRIGKLALSLVWGALVDQRGARCGPCDPSVRAGSRPRRQLGYSQRGAGPGGRCGGRPTLAIAIHAWR